MHCDQFLRTVPQNCSSDPTLVLEVFIEKFLRVRESERAAERRGKRFAPLFGHFAARSLTRKNRQGKALGPGYLDPVTLLQTLIPRFQFSYYPRNQLNRSSKTSR